MKRKKSLSKKQQNSYITIIKVKKSREKNYKKILGIAKTNYKRSKITISENQKELSITITAEDATALRASANMIMRDLQIIENTDKVIT